MTTYSAPLPPEKLDKNQQINASNQGAIAQYKIARTALEKEIKKAEASVKKITDDIKRYTDAKAAAEKRWKNSNDSYNHLKVLAATQLAANGGDKNSHNTTPTGYEYAYLISKLNQNYPVLVEQTKALNVSIKEIDAIVENIRVNRLVDAEIKLTAAKNSLTYWGIKPIDKGNPNIQPFKVEKIKRETLSSSSSSSSSSTANTPPGTIIKPPSGFLAYTYNIPMISNNYFNGVELHKLNGDFNTALPSISKDAKQFWSPGVSGKGTLQADRILYNNQDLSQKLLSRKNSKFQASDLAPQLWGFRFLYNPETVNMGWGAINATDPVYESLNQDQFAAATANLISSTLDFNLVLNYIYL
jgi:hypothetical protein